MSGAITFFAFKSWFRTKGGLLGPFIFLSLMFSIEGSFWWTLSQRGNVGDYTFNGLLFYSFCALVLSQVIACQGEPDSLSEKVEAGTLDTNLLRPLNTLSQLFSQQLGMTAARMSFGIPFISVFVFVFNQTVGVQFIGFFICVLLAGLINVALNTLIATATFWLRESYAFVVVKETLFWMLSGALIPLDIYPTSIQVWAQYLPPAYTVFLPIKVLQGEASFLEVFYGQAITISCLWAMTHILFRFGVARYQAYGS